MGTVVVRSEMVEIDEQSLKSEHVTPISGSRNRRSRSPSVALLTATTTSSSALSFARARRCRPWPTHHPQRCRLRAPAERAASPYLSASTLPAAFPSSAATTPFLPSPKSHPRRPEGSSAHSSASALSGFSTPEARHRRPRHHINGTALACLIRTTWYTVPLLSLPSFPPYLFLITSMTMTWTFPTRGF